MMKKGRKGSSRDNPVTKYSVIEVLRNKEFNGFLDGLMKFPEVTRITLADHLLESGWDDCDIDLDIEIKGGSVNKELGEFLHNYPVVSHFWGIEKTDKKHYGEVVLVGGRRTKFRVVGGYYLEISWGHKPYTVPYIVLRDRSIKRKKQWVP